MQVIRTLDPKQNQGSAPEVQALKNQLHERERMIHSLEVTHTHTTHTHTPHTHTHTTHTHLHLNSRSTHTYLSTAIFVRTFIGTIQSLAPYSKPNLYPIIT